METETDHKSADPEQARQHDTEDRLRTHVELWGAYALILLTIWAPRPLQRWLYLCAVVWVAVCAWRSFPGWAAWGFRRKGFAHSLWAPLVACGILLAARGLATALGPLHQPHGIAGWTRAFGGYVIWALVQQFLLQGYFFLRFERLLSGGAAPVLAAASVFALAHLPNPILTPVTLIWGFCACLIFQRFRNLLPLAVAHAILGICVATTVPAPVMHNMRVGLGYLRYQAPHSAAIGYHTDPVR